MKRTRKKSDKLPKYWTKQREILNIHLLTSEDFKKNLNKGLRFFTLEELDELEIKYKRGISWRQVDMELSKKGINFKKATFRKYIQDKKISPASYYRATKKGREAIYARDTIRQINFLKYFYKYADNEFIDVVLEAFSQQNIPAIDAIEDQLWGTNLREAVFMYLRNMSDDDNDIERTLNDVLSHDPDFREEAIDGLNAIYNEFHDKFKKWESMLRDHKVQISEK